MHSCLIISRLNPQYLFRAYGMCAPSKARIQGIKFSGNLLSWYHTSRHTLTLRQCHGDGIIWTRCTLATLEPNEVNISVFMDDPKASPAFCNR